MTGPATSTHIGQPVRRREDLRLVTGTGSYTDDVTLLGQAYAVMVRSPHAHARIRAIDTAPAVSAPGVLAVLTGRDLLADGLNPIPHKVWSQHPAEIMLREHDGFKTFTAPHYALPAGKVRFVGEAVAVVIATTVAAAKDGAERVAIDYEPLPAVTDTRQAARADAPRLFDEARSNVVVDGELGDRAATEAAFARAAHVVKFDTWIQRVTGVPMEPRAAVCAFDAATGRYTLYAGNGGAWRLKDDLATILGVPPDRVRVIMRDVGGNFGTRGMIYAEFAIVAWAARRLGRPVKWTAERHEGFLGDYQARDLAVTAELALDREGNFLAMRGSNLSNAGAHTTNYSPLQKGVEIMTTIYRIPAAWFRARAVVSNTSPTRPYRSAGRPEVMHVMERLIDLACQEHGFDRVDIRRRNLVAETEFPYRNAFGMIYDSGSYAHTMDWALAMGDWDGFPARRAAARGRGKYRGIAVANYLDTATGVPRERTEMTVHLDGTIDVVIGTSSQGQGHETSFAQLVTEWYGVPIDKVRIITLDTDILKFGGGAHSGRGMRLASLIMWKATQDIVARGKRVAALLLQAKPEAMQFAGGKFLVAGTDRGIGLFEVAAAMRERADLPEDLRGPLAATCDEVVADASFPFGSHVCEVEIDPETGTVEIIKYCAVDDVGRAVNPMIIDGQTHGGIVQGLGQALQEHCHYDADSGQLLSASFMDYAMPRASQFPAFDTGISETPTPTHPLGIRPAGEGGTTPALAVAINAIVDALSEFGVRHIEMPATPERIWRAIHGKALKTAHPGTQSRNPMTMILRGSPLSPFVRKIRMAILHLGLSDQIEIIKADAANPDDPLRRDNPLGKIPVLLTGDGKAVYDSRVILEYLDHVAGGGVLIPRDWPARLDALTLQAMCDGVMDACILIVYEARHRPDAIHHPPWVEYQRGKVARAVAAFAKAPPDPARFDVGTLTAACMLGYLDLRRQIDWRADFPALQPWLDTFRAKHPEYDATVPPAS